MPQGQVFGLYGLDLHRFPALELRLMFGLFKIPVYSGFRLDMLSVNSITFCRNFYDQYKRVQMSSNIQEYVQHLFVFLFYSNKTQR